MPKSRSAAPVIFGYDFQSNAAIVLMLENMREMMTIKVEGKEDIEICILSGKSRKMRALLSLCGK